MAAYWFEIAAMPPESKLQRPPRSARVSTYPWSTPLPYSQSQRRRGGISGNVENPTNPSSVVATIVFRQSR